MENFLPEIDRKFFVRKEPGFFGVWTFRKQTPDRFKKSII
jgi:hypothetical protein